MLVVIAPLERRTIVAFFAILVALLAVGGRAPQARTVLVLRIGQLATVLDLRQSPLHIIELGRVNDVLVARRKDFRNLLLAVLDAIGRLRMCGESFCQ